MTSRKRRLYVQRTGLVALVILSMEDVTQADPLVMALYGIAWHRPRRGRLLLRGAPCRPAGRLLPRASEILAGLCAQEDRPEPKRIFVAAKLPAKWSGGRRYHGGFVGSQAMERKWAEEKVQEWVSGVRALARIAQRYPQTAYTGFAVSLQAEWQ